MLINILYCFGIYMKGKIRVWVLFWCIGIIYVISFYTIISQNTDETKNPVTSNEVRSLGDTEPNNSYTSRPYTTSGDRSSSKWQLIANSHELKAKSSLLCFQKTCFTVEIADTQPEQELWLMNRTGLDENEGMLFIFPAPAPHSFRMKNTLIPLDIIWFDADFTVVDTASMVPCITDPCTVYTPKNNALSAVEIAAGEIKILSITIGDIWVLKN